VNKKVLCQSNEKLLKGEYLKVSVHVPHLKLIIVKSEKNVSNNFFSKPIKNSLSVAKELTMAYSPKKTIFNLHNLQVFSGIMSKYY
jgi:hypothetical protein